MKDEDINYKLNKQMISDIILTLTKPWTQWIEYSKTLSDHPRDKEEQGTDQGPFIDRYFAHTDFSIDNVVMCEDYSLKILDPDSFAFVNKLEHTEKYFVTQFELGIRLANLRYV